MLKSPLHTDSLKQAYEESLIADKIQLTQIATVTGIIIILGSMYMDTWAIPSSLYGVLIIRLLIITILLFTLASTFYTPFFIKNYTKILIASIILTSFSIEYSIYQSKPSELAYYTYFAGLGGVFMILYSWTYISFTKLLLTTSLIISGYIISIALRENQGPHGVIPLLIVTLTILLGMTSIGVVGRLISDKHHQEKFILQQSLQNSLEEKLKESDEHEYYANHDVLTGLPNRRFAENHLTTRLTKIKHLDMLMIVMFLDLNGFKKINDDYGHDAGDEILKVTANRLKFCLNKKDVLIRLGGDEFLICLTIEKSNADIIGAVQNRIRAAINQPIMFEGSKLKITTSIGVATSLKDGNEINTLIAIADKRMYQDKIPSKEGKSISNNVTVLSPKRA